jgi:hypothetical protein
MTLEETATSELQKMISPAVLAAGGSFIAAWLGARFAFKKTRRERAFDRQVEWFERTIDALAHYEEALTQLSNDFHRELFIRRPPLTPTQGKVDLPARFRPDAKVWKVVADTEAALRVSLQLHEVFTKAEIGDLCAPILSRTATVAGGPLVEVAESPEVTWTDLPSRTMQLANLRRSLEDELRLLLGYGSWLRRKWPRLWRKLEVRRLGREITKSRRASQAPTRQSDA